MLKDYTHPSWKNNNNTKLVQLDLRLSPVRLDKGEQQRESATSFSSSLLFASKVLSIIKWRGPKSNELHSKFWKQVVYEMPAKRRETLSRRQVRAGSVVSAAWRALVLWAGGWATLKRRGPDVGWRTHLSCPAYDESLVSLSLTLSYCVFLSTVVHYRVEE